MGSEMCIRDRKEGVGGLDVERARELARVQLAVLVAVGAAVQTQAGVRGGAAAAETLPGVAGWGDGV